jgi:hypothetical protein
MRDILTNLTGIDERIAILRENPRELVEQAAPYSGAADEELTSRRIAEQEAQLELLTKQRGELFNKKVATTGNNIASTTRARRNEMSDSRVKKNMEVIGADGVHIGTAKGTTKAIIIVSMRDWWRMSKGERCAYQRTRQGRLPWRKSSLERSSEASSNNKVVRVPLLVTSAANGSVYRKPRGLRFGPDGHLYCVSRDEVVAFDFETSEFLGAFAMMPRLNGQALAFVP